MGRLALDPVPGRDDPFDADQAQVDKLLRWEQAPSAATRGRALLHTMHDVAALSGSLGFMLVCASIPTPEDGAGFVASLPKAALASQHGPRAVIGHVDLAFRWLHRSMGCVNDQSSGIYQETVGTALDDEIEERRARRARRAGRALLGGRSEGDGPG